MMRISEDILLFCEDISKTYPGGNMQTEVLKQVNLQFKKASINLIYGKSGSGKSTLLNILAGLDQASHGEVGLLSWKKLQLHERLPGGQGKR